MVKPIDQNSILISEHMHIAALLQCFLIMLGICIGIKRFGKQQLAFRSKTASLDAVRLFSGTK